MAFEKSELDELMTRDYARTMAEYGSVMDQETSAPGRFNVNGVAPFPWGKLLFYGAIGVGVLYVGSKLLKPKPATRTNRRRRRARGTQEYRWIAWSDVTYSQHRSKRAAQRAASKMRHRGHTGVDVYQKPVN